MNDDRRRAAALARWVLVPTMAAPLALVGLAALTSAGERRIDVDLAWAVAATFLARFVVFAALWWVMWRRSRTPDALGAALLLLFGGMAVMALAFAVGYGAVLLAAYGVANPPWLQWVIRLAVAATAVETTLAGLAALAALRDLGLLRPRKDA